MKSDKTDGICVCIFLLENAAINRWLNLLDSLLQFTSAYFEFSFATKKHKDWNTQHRSFASFFLDKRTTSLSH
jgi:hypothetical protein